MHIQKNIQEVGYEADNKLTLAARPLTMEHLFASCISGELMGLVRMDPVVNGRVSIQLYVSILLF